MDSKHISFWNEVHTIIDEAMEKHDRSVSVYICLLYTSPSPRDCS